MAPHDITTAASAAAATSLLSVTDATAATSLGFSADATSIVSSADAISIVSATDATSLLPTTAFTSIISATDPTSILSCTAATSLLPTTSSTSMISATDPTSLLSAITPSRAYVTNLTGDDDDVKAVVGLAKGLRKVDSKYSLVVAVSPDVPEEHRQLLVSQGCIVREVEPVQPPENQIRYAMAHVRINYSKLRIWQFEEYSKMVYLDADIQVFENIDHLFDYPDDCIFAAMECFCAIENTWSHSPHYCQHSPDKVQWDAKMGPPPVSFDAGLFVFEPNSDIYHGLLALLNTPKNTTPLSPVGFKDLLNMFFKQTYLPLPYMYNFNLAMLLHHPEHELDKVKVVRYCPIESKPWRYIGEEQQQIHELMEKWWEIYNDESLNYDNYIASLEADTELK